MGTTTTPDPKQAQPDHDAPVATEHRRTQIAPLLERVVDATPEFKREVEQFEFARNLAKMFWASGLFQDLKNFSETQGVAAALTKIELGRTMGFSPAESMQGIDIVLGRLGIGAHLRATRMKQAGYSWKFRQHDEKGCQLALYYRGQPIMEDRLINGKWQEIQATVNYTEADARAAGLIKDGGGYKKNPKNMYFCRAVSNAQRWYAPEVLGAGTELPSSEEIADFASEYEGAEPSRPVATGDFKVPQRPITAENFTDLLKAEQEAKAKAEAEAVTEQPLSEEEMRQADLELTKTAEPSKKR